jgi:hypothetical protein
MVCSHNKPPMEEDTLVRVRKIALPEKPACQNKDTKAIIIVLTDP